MRETMAQLMALTTVVLIGLMVTLFAWQQKARMQALESRIDPQEWSALYPLHVAAFMRGAERDAGAPGDKLAANPFRERAWAGHAFSLEYNHPRAHYYAQIDQHHSRRTQERTQPAGCIHCHAAEAPQLVQEFGWDALNAMLYEDIQHRVHHGSTCTDCHAADTMALQVNRPALIEALALQGIDINDASRHEMRSYVCAQCHVEYYFRPGTQELVLPWANGLMLEDMETFFDDIGFSDWQHAETGASLVKIQHPNFELHSTSVHARHDTSCADCHMPVIQDGGMRVTDHAGGNPLDKVEVACMNCHSGSTPERLTARSLRVQQNTRALMDNTEAAMEALMDAIVEARDADAGEEALAAAREAHRQAHIRWDFIDADASLGFHAQQEAVRLLTDAASIARESADALLSELSASSNDTR